MRRECCIGVSVANIDIAVIAVLLAVVVAAQLVETVAGFGATIISLSVGAHFVPIETLVVTLVLIGLMQSTWLVVRGRVHVQWRLLLTRVLPPAAVGLAAGNIVFQSVDAASLKPVLGVFVIAFASWRLWQLFGKKDPSTLPAFAGVLLTLGGGFFHGLLASGGPLIVSYASRAITDRHAFRATLSTLWLALNTALLISYALHGQLVMQPVTLTVLLVPAVFVGILLGELIHHRINEVLFRKVVQVLLLGIGVSLLR